MNIFLDDWYCYFPVPNIDIAFVPAGSKDINVTEEEERWIEEAYMEFAEVQKFIAAKIEQQKKDSANGQ